MELTDSYKRVLPKEVLDRYEVIETRQAAAVLQNTSPQEFEELIEILSGFVLTENDIITPGKNESKIAARLNAAFREKGWREGRYDTKITSTLRMMPYRPAGEKKATELDSEVFSEGYKVDNVKGSVALDVEWNAKDGNLDRDVGAYRSLYDSAIISVGVMVTRTADDLRALGAKYGRDTFLGTTTTTNLPKLQHRLARGDGGGCPILAIAISANCFDPDAVAPDPKK